VAAVQKVQLFHQATTRRHCADCTGSSQHTGDKYSLWCCMGTF